ncbi:MAG: hypothetical protein WD579_00355 [Candidatus Paceibacterota bacterium]
MPLEHRRGTIIRVPETIDAFFDRHESDHDIYTSTADRKEEAGDTSGAEHYRKIAVAVSKNLDTFKQVLELPA